MMSISKLSVITMSSLRGRSAGEKLVTGFPPEIKLGETRFLGTASLVSDLRSQGVPVVIKRGSGRVLGINDSFYRNLGVTLVDSDREVFRSSDLIVMVKELQPAHYNFVSDRHIIFDYAHLANPVSRDLLKFLLENRVTNIAFETMRDKYGFTFALHPMSVIAGNFAAEKILNIFSDPTVGTRLSENVFRRLAPREGRVFILGGGTAGTAAAHRLLLNGVNVTLAEINPGRITYLNSYLSFLDYVGRLAYPDGSNKLLEIVTPPDGQRKFSGKSLVDYCGRADAIIGAVYLPGAQAPCLITENLLQRISRQRQNRHLPPLSIVDIATDQGGCVFSGDIHTNHDEPWARDQFGNLICNIPNMPAAYPRWASPDLAQAIRNPLLALATRPFQQALKENPELLWGLNTIDGMVTIGSVAQAHGLSATPIFDALEQAEIEFDLPGFRQAQPDQYYCLQFGVNPDRGKYTPSITGTPVQVK